VKKFTFLALAVPAFAHWPWIETNGKLHFGVFPHDRMTGARIEGFQKAKLWTLDEKGGYGPVQAKVESDALDLGAAAGYPMSHTYGVYEGHGPATLVLYGAKAFRGGVAKHSPETLPVDIVGTGPGRFRLLRNGKPLAGALISAYTSEQGRHDGEHKHDKSESGELPPGAMKATTGKAGEFSFHLQGPGEWQLHVAVKEPVAGTYEGKRYQSVTLIFTLRFDTR